MKMKLMSAALAMTVLLGGALANANAANGSGSTSPSPPVPAGYYQGWYSQYIVTWNGGMNTGTYSIQIQTTYISGSTYAACATALSAAMSKVKVYQWAGCVMML